MNRIKLVLDAINSVKLRARKALNDGNNIEYTKLMYDLWTLQACLTGECEIAVKQDDSSEKKAA